MLTVPLVTPTLPDVCTPSEPIPILALARGVQGSPSTPQAVTTARLKQANTTRNMWALPWQRRRQELLHPPVQMSSTCLPYGKITTIEKGKHCLVASLPLWLNRPAWLSKQQSAHAHGLVRCHHKTCARTRSYAHPAHQTLLQLSQNAQTACLPTSGLADRNPCFPPSPPMSRSRGAHHGTAYSAPAPASRPDRLRWKSHCPPQPPGYPGWHSYL
mmetsp:Transcript_23616/g.41852  ORF Transcript_23616/g.41852 Transcript_23616/m.41852 type:complete len:215 (+) Transcript_23616:4983-5627(+)